jgi:hypothetical protein
LSLQSTIVAAAQALGARSVRGWSPGEESLSGDLEPISQRQLRGFQEQIVSGDDPLGELFCQLRSPEQRRKSGATFTPKPIVNAMVHWGASFGAPMRVVDPGTGTGRYLLAAGRRLPEAFLVGIEIDPLAAIAARANLAAAGFAHRAEIIVADYRSVSLPVISGRTLYVGNPPYVRHHLIEAPWKAWLVKQAARSGIAASQLAGLHAHFFLATALTAAPRDYGAFITAAEWLDVNYGQLVRDLFLADLGGQQIVVIEPRAMPFPDATTTAAVTYFEIGSQPKTLRLKRISNATELDRSNGNRLVRRERLASESRWSHLTRSIRKGPVGYVELGELCRVHRGQVTGANRIWIEGEHSKGMPSSVLYRTVTRAVELFRAGYALTDASVLRQVIDLPRDLDVFQGNERRAVEAFLRHARSFGAHLGYVATNRKTWWSVGLKHPAPILATYMARRPPAFVRNQAGARHINIAHGLYPREPMSETVLKNLVNHLATQTHLADGRTYAGGLTKFEPREMERLLVPNVDMLRRMPS